MSSKGNRVLRSKGERQDDSIMGTNNSSIVSKRSVERLYYANEPQLFRHFVKKPQRRAPLINRGYWLRMRAIDVVVRQFLEEASVKPKIIINLGCGYDPLPWQCFTRYPEFCKHVTFVDIDYKELMLKKFEVVKFATELNKFLSNTILSENGDIPLRSDQYIQIGCDLREISRLSKLIHSVVNVDQSSILFTAEVSITYMDLEAADKLLKWAASLPDARFCLLEQILPDGPHHPFAQTMLAHFEKLQTPLGSVLAYRTLADQERRFQTCGWIETSARSLWDLWDDNTFISTNERISLDFVEPFDEWEEFALFSSHYLLLEARNTSPKGQLSSTPLQNICTDTLFGRIKANMHFSEYRNENCKRRFAAPIRIRSTSRDQDVVGNLGGIGTKSRISSCDIYSQLYSHGQFHKNSPSQGPSARMCHSVTDLGDQGAILIGGRASPDSAMADCWYYEKWTNTWERVDDLPTPRYRHCSISLDSNFVLTYGGKIDSTNIAKDCLIWSRRRGWVKCIFGGTERDGDFENDPPVLFGALILKSRSPYRGFLLGGINRDNRVSRDVWSWQIYDVAKDPSICFRRCRDVNESARKSLSRFGATVVQQEGCSLIIGGISGTSLVSSNVEILKLSNFNEDDKSLKNLLLDAVTFDDGGESYRVRPLLVGISAMATSGNSVLVMGGGAVCFSFGTYWNKGCFNLNYASSLANIKTLIKEGNLSPIEKASFDRWSYLSTNDGLQTTVKSAFSKHSAEMEPPELGRVPRIKLSSADEFNKLVLAGIPTILEGLDLGDCVSTWTVEHLTERVDATRQVTVHVASNEHMDFKMKNFKYETKTFGSFMKDISNGEKTYLRALSAEKPSESPTTLTKDFPEIAADFHLPEELAIVKEGEHSSPLRISGPVTMWLHYDVMANVLCQIRGNKRLILFPPSDVAYLDLAPGASSSSIKVFESLEQPALAGTHPSEAILQPGDVLFIPAFWLHTASPSGSASIAVNVFFRDLVSGYAPGRDVYGNRDLQAYEKARHDVARISRSFDALPAAAKNFYLQRLGRELQCMAT